MKRSILIITIVFISLFVGITIAKASSVDAANETIMFARTNADKCNALLGDPNKNGDLAYYLQMALDIMKYAGIILCIVLTILDFFKALFGEDKEMYKPLTKKMFARFFYAVVLFFLPSLVETLLTLIDVYGTCSIG